MSKVLVSVADKLKQMRHIPENMIPATLKYQIALPKFHQIKI